jgi:hypothetical protein
LAVFPLARAEPPDAGPFLPWVRTGADIQDGLGSGQGIGIQFNKPMDGESLRKAVRLEPALSGRIEILSPASLVYIPDREPECETLYTLIVSGDTKDTGGLPVGEDFVCRFTPDIPFLRIPALSVNSEPPMEVPDGDGYYAFPLADSTAAVGISLRFSLPLSGEAMAAAALGISLDPWFPASLGPVVLTAVTCSEDTLLLKWEGLEPGKPEEPHFYRFAIPGGKSGITNGRGSYLKNPQTVYMEVLGL